MTNDLIQIKLRQRLNKLSSNDFDNLECWQIIEAFNKAALQWCRRQLHGMNQYKEGDEGSQRRIDDLNVLLVEQALTGSENDSYFESNGLPDNYLEYKRLSTKAKNKCCKEPYSMTVYLVEEANIDLILRDPLKKPDFDWAETVATFIGNRVRIYRDEEFSISQPTLTYYRKPTTIQITGCVNPQDGSSSSTNVESEFRDDIVELIIDEAASLIAGDIENVVQMQRGMQSAERSN
jgi:hypothetical protein